MIIVLLHRQPDQFNQVIQEMEAAGFAHIALTSVIASDQPLMKQALTAFGSDFRVRLAFDRFDSLRNELVTGVENIEEVLALSKVAPTAVLDVEERLGAGKISMLEAAHIPVGTGFDPGENPADAFKEAAIELTMRMPRSSRRAFHSLRIFGPSDGPVLRFGRALSSRRKKHGSSSRTPSEAILPIAS